MKRIFCWGLIGMLLSFTAVAGDEIQVECRTDLTIGEERFQGHYKVLRRGEAMFGIYRHQEDQVYQETDDVVLKTYIGRRLEDYAVNGPLALIAHTAEVELAQIKKVIFYGIEVKTAPDGTNGPDTSEDYEAVLWLLYDIDSRHLGTVALPGWEMTKCLE